MLDASTKRNEKKYNFENQSYYSEFDLHQKFTPTDGIVITEHLFVNDKFETEMKQCLLVCLYVLYNIPEDIEWNKLK